MDGREQRDRLFLHAPRRLKSQQQNAAETGLVSAALFFYFGLFAAAASGAAVGVDLAVVDLAVRLLHELLELIFKAGIPGGRRDFTSVRRGAAVGIGRARGICRARRVRCGLSRARRISRARGARLSLLDGEIDLPCLVDTEDLYLDGVTDLQIVVDVVDVGVGNLRNMYKTALAAGKQYERSEFGDACDFAFLNRSDFQLYGVPFLFSFNLLIYPVIRQDKTKPFPRKLRDAIRVAAALDPLAQCRVALLQRLAALPCLSQKKLRFLHADRRCDIPRRGIHKQNG